MLMLATAIFGVLLAAQTEAASISAVAITAPAGAIVLPTGTTLSGISVAATGANATTDFTVGLSCTGCVMTASGTNVGGSGTNSITIGPDTSAQLSSALATLKVAWPTAVLSASDTITVTASAGGTSAAPSQIAVSIDGNEYLVYGTTAAAQARSQAQCAALGCDGTQTKCWWHVSPLAGTTITGDNCTGTASPDAGAAIQIRPGDPCFDATNAGSTCAVAHPSVGLSSAEQSSLVAATAAGLPVP